MDTFKNLLGNFELLFDDEKDFLINAVRKGLVYLEVFCVVRFGKGLLSWKIDIFISYFSPPVFW